MTNCLIAGNSSNGLGGGILNRGNSTIESSTISGNGAGYGGGVLSTGMLRMARSVASRMRALRCRLASAQSFENKMRNSRVFPCLKRLKRI